MLINTREDIAPVLAKLAAKGFEVTDIEAPKGPRLESPDYKFGGENKLDAQVKYLSLQLAAVGKLDVLVKTLPVRGPGVKSDWTDPTKLFLK